MSDELFESVRRFAAHRLGCERARVTAETSLFHDLGVDGADGCDFMEAFGSRFDVEMSAFDASLHFGPEAGGNPFVWLWWDLTRSWPRMVPITISDLAAAAHSARWATPDRPARPAS
jgi:acyl carrier protein